MRLPARVRILAALAVCGVLHAGFSAEIEGIRARALASLPLPPPAKSPPSPGHDDLKTRVLGWSAGRTQELAARARVAVPVLFFRDKDRVAIIGAGRESGLDVADQVVVPAGLLGVIEAVDAHVSRVRLLSAPKSRIPVMLAETRPGLPGGVPALHAVLQGAGDGGLLVTGSLLTEFREGDRLVAPDARDPGRPVDVGVVLTAGPSPRVRIHAGPGDLGLVAVPAERAPREGLFEDRVLRVRAAPLAGGAGALVSGAGAEGVTPGCAVHSGHRYLGRVVVANGRGVVASRLGDRGHRVFVRCLGPSKQTWTGELVATGSGTFGLDGAAPPPSVTILLAVTAGGQDLVPADLAVGFLDRSGDGWTVRDLAAAWPENVTVSAFAFDDELRRLLGTASSR